MIMVEEKHPDYMWERYPYHQPEAVFSYPADEGRHDPLLKYRKEWWYINFHLTGKTTGVKYGAFISFFKTYPARIFSISDINSQKVYNNIKPGILNSKKNHLELSFISPYKNDYFFNKKEKNKLVPFQYKLNIGGKAKEEKKEMMQLNVDMHCIKPPMIVGNGLVDMGEGWSNYYCQTKIEASGTIKVHGITEPVEGYAWIDHQWGKFNTGLPNKRILWEWFSIKLDDFREIVVGDQWVMHSRKYIGTYTKGLNLFNADFTHEILENYKIKQLDYWYDKRSGRKFARSWRITEPSKDIDLTITSDCPDQAMHVIIDPIAFWEGSCSVSGTIEGKTVSGKAYVELSHSWEKD
jgi:predicted secreted hydrolase